MTPANWLRFGWRRKLLVKLSGHLPSGRIQDWLLDFLYPSDLGMTFK